MKYGYFWFENRSILKSAKIYISASFVLFFEKCLVIVSVKLPCLPWVGGRYIVPEIKGFEWGKKVYMNIFSISEGRNDFVL